MVSGDKARSFDNEYHQPRHSGRASSREPESRYCKRMGPSSSRHRELKMDSGLRHEAHPGMTGGEIGDL
jgi:hypothetical protein